MNMLFPQTAAVIALGLLVLRAATAATTTSEEIPGFAPSNLAMSQQIEQTRATAASPQELVAWQMVFLDAHRPVQRRVEISAAQTATAQAQIEAAAENPALDEKTRLRLEVSAAQLAIEFESGNPRALVAQKMEFERLNADTLAYLSPATRVPKVDLSRFADTSPMGREILAHLRIIQGFSPQEMIRQLGEFRRASLAARQTDNP